MDVLSQTATIVREDKKRPIRQQKLFKNEN